MRERYDDSGEFFVGLLVATSFSLALGAAALLLYLSL
jgi:hypothetical protein